MCAVAHRANPNCSLEKFANAGDVSPILILSNR